MSRRRVVAVLGILAVVVGFLWSTAQASKVNKNPISRRTWSYLLPAETPITHPELTNREMWIDFFSQNPITKVYRLYKQLDSAGIHPDELDVVQLPNTINDEHF